MGLLNKKPDPISEKSRALEAEIAALETEIKKLDTQLTRSSAPRYRSTATPQGAIIQRGPEKPSPPPPRKAEPVFEEVKRSPLAAAAAAEAPEIYNDLGVRKYDLPALWKRITNHLHGPSANNPRLVTLLAAGGVDGLKPLRYEKRIARNRVLVLGLVLFAILLGTFLIFLRNR
jgi:hypothetical protein